MSYEIGLERSIDGFSLRAATLGDSESMALLTQQAVASRKGEAMPTAVNEAVLDEAESIRERLADSLTWSMLVEDEESGELAGLVLGYPETQGEFVEDAEDKEHLSLLMVHPNYQGKGIGGLLLDWVMAYLQSKGTKAVYLWTEVDNYQSRPIYEHRGWQLTGAERIHPKYKDAQVQYVLELHKD